MLGIIFPQPFIHSESRTSNPVTVSNQSETTSERGTLLTVMSEENDSLTTPVTVSNQSKLQSECETLLTVIDNQEEPVTVSNRSNKRRSKGYGTGRIQWRTQKSSSGKEYKQPWYDWQVNEGGKTKTRTKYIPKRLLASVQELDASKAPVQEVLRVLGSCSASSSGEMEKCQTLEQKSPKKKSEAPTVFLGEIEKCRTLEQKSPKKKSEAPTVFLGEISALGGHLNPLCYQATRTT